MLSGIRPTLFILFSLLLIVFTLRRPYHHRFYRLFVFESVLGLIFLNANHWFEDPFSPTQILSWILLIGSAVLALHGFQMLRSMGAPDGDIETTTQLVTSGAYRYIRHPLYGSLLIFGTGALLKRVYPVSALLFIVLCGFVYATARTEERGNIERFGEAYLTYKKKTKMFIPYLL